MNQSPLPDPEITGAPLHQRVTDLELLLTHLQRTLEQLNHVLIEQQGRIERIDLQMLRLSAEIRALRGVVDESREPQDDVPPHY